MEKKIVLIDGHSILNRAFYGLPDLTNAKGEHTNAVYGFLNIMLKILEEEKPDYLTVAFDVKQPTFRHVMFEEYKGTRKPMPEELRQQVPLVKEVLMAMHITVVEKPGYEADDVLGTIARRAEEHGMEVSLVSGDRDLLQLATDKIKIRIPKTKRTGTEIEDYYPTDVMEKYQVTPLQIIDLKGLMGDTADNIPGVPGIGEKTATKIIKEFGSVEEAILHVDEITPKKARENLKEFEEKARLSKVLATIKTDCELEYSLDEATLEDMFNEEAFKIMKRLEFKSLLSKFDQEQVKNEDIEKCFLSVKGKKEAENVFILAKDCLSKEKEIGLALIAEDSVLEFASKKKENFMEANGQFSLFAQEEPKEELLLATIIAIDEQVYYLETSKEISEAWIVEKLSELLGTKGIIAVLDLKRMLYILDKLFKAYQMEAEVLLQSMERNIIDLSVAQYLLQPLQESYEYDDIARDCLGMALISKKDFQGKKSLLECKKEKAEEFKNYCCYQSFVSKKAYKLLMDELEATEMMCLYKDVELPLVYVLFAMEQRGIRVNKGELKKYGEKLEVRILELEKEIYELAGETFNINSPKQLGVILFEKLQLPFAKKTKTGYSTSADILDKLKNDYPIVAKILEYRQLSKLKSTYADGLANFICEEDGRIHGKFNQTITATGRLSSTEPNLQNIPIRMEIGREIRKVFIPRDGYVFLDADYSQIELRILAHMSGDDSLITAYNSGKDIHRITASEVFHTPFEEVTSQQRSNAKAVNFGIVYGISSFGLGQDLHISKKEAEEYIERYFATYPGIKKFLDSAVEIAKKEGFVASLMGRRRPVPELSSSNFMQRSFGERIAMNSPIQGTAADIMKVAMVRVEQRIKEEQLQSKLLLQIHDELLVETHPDEVEQVKQILEEEMSRALELLVPLEVEVKEGNNWNEAH